MAKYNVTATFSLETEIEPEGIRFDMDAGDGSVSDESYWGRGEVEVDGGVLKFEIEAEDEDHAEAEAREVVFDGQEFEDDNSLTWLASNVSYEVEVAEEEPPSIGDALCTLGEFAASRQDDPEFGSVARAALVVLDEYESLGRRVTSLEARLEEATQRLNGLVAEVTALRAG